MRVIIEPDYQALSQWAANYVANKINAANPTSEKPFVLGCPTGSSPLGMYKALVELNKQGKRIFSYFAADKYLIQIGQASKIKNDSPVSGDSLLQIRLNDGKYLLAISDGMGSGPEARKSSQIAIKMLERLLMSGFDKDTSIDLINTTIMNANEEIFATLDIAIIDLYNGKVEFIKNGACPTYVKNKKKVQIVKSLSLPAGILNNINYLTAAFKAELATNAGALEAAILIFSLV